MPSRTAAIRALAKHDDETAIVELAVFLQETFEIEVSNVEINHDQYSLNSLNGFFRSGNEPFFFKFHQEEGEEDMKGEYYRAEIIANVKLPIDMPIMTSTMPGEQILVYRRRNDKRFSDVLLTLDKNPDEIAEDLAANAERVLNNKILDVALKTLHPVSKMQVADEPIHHLFHDRMIDLKTGECPGGRYKEFYVGQTFEFPGARLSWQQFSNASLVINGQEMATTFGGIFDAALHYLHADNLAEAGGIVAHGDAHNANVWYQVQSGPPTLSYFDPAFAGEHIPSLLAEAKATFHNIFAHPLWLYNSEDAAATYGADASYKDGKLSINTDWKISRVREKLLDAKIDCFWRPFLKHLDECNMLPSTWRQTLRSALAMCPALVMNLRGNVDRHNPISSAIAFSVIGICGSEPVSGTNVITEFLDRIGPS